MLIDSVPVVAGSIAVQLGLVDLAMTIYDPYKLGQPQVSLAIRADHATSKT